MADFSLRPAEITDLPSILAITNEAIATTDSLWITTPFTLAQRQSWFDGRIAAGFPVLVAVDQNDRVLGYGSYGPFRTFEGYALTVEHSVYVAAEHQRRGIGRALLAALIDRARAVSMHVMVAGITADNAPSVALHRAFGFREHGTLPQVGRKFGRWLDLLFMTLQLDETSFISLEKDLS